MPTIRPYVPRDHDAFLALDIETGLMNMPDATAEQRDAFRARWPGELRTRLGWSERGPSGSEHTLHVLDDDSGAYAGHLWLSEQVDLFSNERRLFVTTVAVVAAFRGRGYGRLLMQHALDEGRRRGLAAVGLGVDARNETAIRLYERLGFATTRHAMLCRL